jgi:hypothetical protein
MPSFEHTRSLVIAAPPAAVHALVADLHAWTRWSPWEGLDADPKRTYSGSEKRVGARYVVFRFEPEGSATRVTWTMSGTRIVLLAVMGKLFFDGMIGKDFDKGLTKLKAVAEA